MNIFEYATLDRETQVRYLSKNGVCIATRDTAVEDVLLYQIEKFYVEVYHDKKSEYITKLSFFSSTIPLKPYLAMIDISGLLVQGF